MKEFHINVPGFSIGAKSWGNERLRPVLCLHGKLDNAASFDLLAPFLPGMHLVAIDFPGTGHSSHYPKGVLPHWKNDAFLLSHVVRALKWREFDIIAHSLGSLSATVLAIREPKIVRNLIFIDVLGPTVNFIQNGIKYLNRDIETFLGYEARKPTIFANKESAINDRMKIGPISFQSAEALMNRGTEQSKEGISWTFDRRLKCLSSTLPYEDELIAMFQAIDISVCLIRAEQGIPYSEEIFHRRSLAIRNLSIHSLPGGHHLHMDTPGPVAKVIKSFLS